MTQREGGWWPQGRPRWESPGRTVLEEVLLVVAVVLSLVVGVLAAVVAVLAASVVSQSLAGPEVAADLGVQLVAWGLLVVLVLSLPFALVAAVVALTEFGETRTARRRLRRAAGPPVGGAGGGADAGGVAGGADAGGAAPAGGATDESDRPDETGPDGDPTGGDGDPTGGDGHSAGDDAPDRRR